MSTSDDPDAVWVSEVWTDQATHDSAMKAASLRLDKVAVCSDHVRPLVSKMGAAQLLTVHGGKGLHS